jgi:hypothetical protein
MAAASVSCRTISVEHVTIGCSLAFDAVQTKLEAQLPWLDHTILQCVQEGDVEGALRLMEDAPPCRSSVHAITADCWRSPACTAARCNMKSATR